MEAKSPAERGRAERTRKLTYTTENGNSIRFRCGAEHEDTDDVPAPGAQIEDIKYSGNDPTDKPPDAPTYRFLKGSVLNSVGDGLVEILNPFLRQTITLDMSDPAIRGESRS